MKADVAGAQGLASLGVRGVCFVLLQAETQTAHHLLGVLQCNLKTSSSPLNNPAACSSIPTGAGFLLHQAVATPILLIRCSVLL